MLLQASFSDVAAFFHDKHGGDVIGLMWKPGAKQPAQFKVTSQNYS